MAQQHIENEQQCNSLLFVTWVNFPVSHGPQLKYVGEHRKRRTVNGSQCEMTEADNQILLEWTFFLCVFWFSNCIKYALPPARRMHDCNCSFWFSDVHKSNQVRFIYIEQNHRFSLGGLYYCAPCESNKKNSACEKRESSWWAEWALLLFCDCRTPPAVVS